MPILTSRPAQAQGRRTDEETRLAAAPAVNIAEWVAGMVQFPDDSDRAIRGARQTLEDALECLMLHDFAVIASFSSQVNMLAYEVAVKPFADGPFVVFKTAFRIQP